MPLLVLKIVLAPLLVAGGSLAQRRWGQAVGGRIVGLPLTSLPLLYLLVLAQGTRFAAAAAGATLAGVSGQATLTWTYARVARCHGPVATLAAAVGAFAGTAALLDVLRPAPLVGAVLATVATAALLRAWPAPSAAPRTDRTDQTDRTDRTDRRGTGGQDPAGDTAGARRIGLRLGRAGGRRLGLRMVLAAAFALAVTEVADPLGSHLAGLVTALPVLSLVMLGLTHGDDGPGAVAEFAHGVQRGMYSVITALLVLSLMLPTGHVLLAFAAAIGASLLAQLAGGRAGPPPAPAAPPPALVRAGGPPVDRSH